jgi:hypothetical protein
MRRAGEIVPARVALGLALVAGGRDVPLFARDGQLAFRAPHDGDYVVRLEYPRRRGLLLLAIVLFVAGTIVISKTCATPSSPSAAA